MPRIRHRKALGIPTEREFVESIIKRYCTELEERDVLNDLAQLRRKLGRCARLDYLALQRSGGWSKRWSAASIAIAEAALSDPRKYVEGENKDE